jgi:hypothetical protein
LAAIRLAIVNSLEDEMRFILFLMLLAMTDQGGGLDPDGNHVTADSGPRIDPNG